MGWWGQEWTNFDDLKVSWSKMKKGYLDMEKRFPDSQYNLNNFAKYACMAGDMEVATELLRKIGETSYLQAWQSPFKLFDSCRKAAGVGVPLRADVKETQEKIQARILADQGDKYSQYWVGMEYLQGYPVDEARKAIGMPLLKASAEQGFAPAQAALGMFYWNSRDKAAAFEWYERAALQDDDTRYSLPQLYESGPDRNLIKAYAWYAYNGDEAGRTGVERLTKELTTEQLTTAKKEAERIRNVIQAMP